jgi:uncharacterized protein
VIEPGSQTVSDVWTAADRVVASRLLYPEARAALAAAHRSGRIPKALYRGRREALEVLWDQLDVVEITSTLARSAGDLAERYALRGYDAVHLAVALQVRPDAMASADEELLRAAVALRIALVDARS